MRRMLLLVLLAAVANAAPSISAISPRQPVRLGATSIDLGVAVEGEATQVEVSITGSSPDGRLVQLSGVTLKPETGAALPFHVLLPLERPFSSGGEFAVTAVGVAPDGTRGSPVTKSFRSTDSGPGFGAPSVQATPDGRLIVTVPTTGSIAWGESSIVGVSGTALRAAGGNLRQVSREAFAQQRGVRVYASPVTGSVQWVLEPQATAPVDGVVVADLVLEDAFGRRVSRSIVEFLGDALDSVAGLTVSPSPVLLNGGYGSRLTLRATANFTLAGPSELPLPSAGLTFRSRDESVVLATDDGLLVARQNGQTIVDVEFAGSTTAVTVIVDSNASLTGVAINPLAGEVASIGSTLQLKLAGTLTTAAQVDLTGGVLGTQWLSDNAQTATISSDGLVTGLHAGTATIRARHGGFEATSSIVVRDAVPTLTLSAPSSVQAEQSFELVANPKDDVAVARVEFSINSVPVGAASAAPYLLRYRAPANAGAILRLAATAIDSSGQRSTPREVSVAVVGAAGASALLPVWERPTPGSVVPVGSAITLRVLSGDWTASATLSPLDYQAVRFTVDNAPVATVTLPRLELRRRPVDGTQTLVPLWETSWIPPPGREGTSAVFRAEAVDRAGLTAPVQAVLVSLAADTAPFLSPLSPSTNATVTATNAVPLEFSGIVGDDTMSQGVGVESESTVRRSHRAESSAARPLSLPAHPPTA